MGASRFLGAIGMFLDLRLLVRTGWLRYTVYQTS